MPRLAVVDLVLAAAGGGSSGFGGGGGGGFSGGGGSSGGFGGSSGGSGDFGLVDALILVGIFGVVAIIVVVAAIQAVRFRRKKRERVEAVTRASAEAAEDDAYLAADAVVPAAAELFCAVQDAWGRDDREALRRLVGEDLMVEWERRLEDFAAKGWKNVVEVQEGPKAEYVGLVNREDDSEDRVVLWMTARLVDKVVDRHGATILRNGASSETVSLSEWWTLARVDDRWVLVAIETSGEGVHHLDSAIVASPWSDDAALFEEARVEGAVAAAALPGFVTKDLVDVDLSDDTRAQALDLALADGRFAPDVLEIAARRVVAAWMEAVDGDDAPLLAIADESAGRALLYGGDESERTRVVVRGATIERVRIDRLDVEATPARMHVVVTVRGRRYVEDRDTLALLAGSRDRETTFTERWTLALDGPDDEPWRLAAPGGPVAA